MALFGVSGRFNSARPYRSASPSCGVPRFHSTRSPVRDKIVLETFLNDSSSDAAGHTLVARKKARQRIAFIRAASLSSSAFASLTAVSLRRRFASFHPPFSSSHQQALSFPPQHQLVSPADPPSASRRAASLACCRDSCVACSPHFSRCLRFDSVRLRSRLLSQIGRASCRERAEVSGVVVRFGVL